MKNQDVLKPSKPVNSSNISNYCYKTNEETLVVEFKRRDGGTLNYSYYNVPIEEFFALHASDSPGKYFNANIKNKFKTEKGS